MHDIFPKKEGSSIEKTINKIKNSALEEEIKNAFLENMELIFKNSTGLVFDCDAHLSNFISSEAVILDKPSRGYIHAEEDVAKLYGREKIYDNVEEKINDMVNFYGSEEFAKKTLLFTAPKAITYTLFEMQTEIKHSPSFLEEAIKDIEYSQKKKNMVGLEEIKKGLIKLQKIVA